MEENNKYPIKYAVLELKQRGGYSDGYKDITLGYIISKCYVIESTIKYLSSGGFTVFHQVVFPFKNINIYSLKEAVEKENKYNLGPKNIPKYDACGEISSTNIVSNIYETYNEAIEEANEKNHELEERIIVLKYSKPVDSCIKEFQEQLNLCQIYEKLVTIETNDMNITSEINNEINISKLLNKIRK